MNIYQVGKAREPCRHYAYRKLPNFRTEVRRNKAILCGARKPVPVIEPFWYYLPMVLAYEWLVSDNYYVPARFYGVVPGLLLGMHEWI